MTEEEFDGLRIADMARVPSKEETKSLVYCIYQSIEFHDKRIRELEEKKKSRKIKKEEYDRQMAHHSSAKSVWEFMLNNLVDSPIYKTGIPHVIKICVKEYRNAKEKEGEA